jgi:type VI secretion system ImpC/EvpB family protein
MRPPHELAQGNKTEFRFSEEVSRRDRKGYLWGSAAWAFAMVAIRAYAECGWFADIRGVSQGKAGGGIIDNLPKHTFGTDATGVAVKASVDVALSENAEAELSRQGFIPLCACHDTPFSAFFSNSSVHQPKTYDDVLATTNARISAMMQYTLCASRFAHYLKILGRQKIGAFQHPQQMEDFLNRWLSDYITPDEAAPPSVKARYPLRKGETVVREITSKPGAYQVLMHLQPHYQLDQLSAAIQFQTQLAPPSGRAG